MVEFRIWQIAGWTMLHYLWVGGVLGVIAVVLRRGMRAAGANLRYPAALSCFAVLGIAPLLIAAVVTNSLSPAPRSEPLAETELGSDRMPISLALPAEEMPVEPAASLPALVSSPPPTHAPQPSELLQSMLNRAALSLPWLWVFGTPTTFLLTTIGLLGAERLRRQSRLLEDGPTTETCRRLAAALRISRRVGVGICDRIAAPILVGIFRPLVLLPAAALAGWDAGQLEMVLLHELAHVRRFDNLVNLIQRITESLLFFHPMVWIVSGWVRQEREHCCDELVVARTRQPRAYAEILIRFADQVPTSPFALARTASSMAERSLVARVRCILKKEEQTMQVSRKAVGLMFVGLVALVMTGGYCSLASHAEDTSTGAAKSEVTPAKDLPSEKPQPTSNHDPSQAAFKARLPNGVTVELLGVSENPSVNRPWWRPDGSRLTERPYDSLSYSGLAGKDDIKREFAVRLSNLPSEPMGTSWELGLHLGLHETSSCGPSNPMRPGTSVDDLRAMIARVPAATKTLTVRFGLAAGPWDTLIKCGQQGNMGVPPGTRSGVIFADPVETSDKTVVAQVSYRTGDGQKRIVAVDNKGQVHTASRSRHPVAADVSQLTAVFSDLSLKEIKEFHFQNRPYQWVEFRNVSIQRGQKTDVQVILEEKAAASHAAAKPADAVSPTSDQSATKDGSKTDTKPAPIHRSGVEPNTDEAKAIRGRAQILARVGNEVVLTSDVLIGIDDFTADARIRIPSAKVAEQRAALVREVTAGIDAFSAHYLDPDPVKAMSLSQRRVIDQLVRQQIDIKLIFQDFRKTVPKDAYPPIEESLSREFEKSQLKILMKRENVASRDDLENALRAKGSSLERQKRLFMEKIVAQHWVQQQVKKETNDNVKKEPFEKRYKEWLDKLRAKYPHWTVFDNTVHEVLPAGDQSPTKEESKTESKPAPTQGLTAELNTEEAKAIAEIEKLGGKVTIDEKSPGRPLVSVDLQSTKVTDAWLVHLKGLTQLQTLDLAQTQVTDAGLVHLEGLTKLQWLNLTWTKVTDVGHLKGLGQLKNLQLSLTEVTDKGLEHVDALKQLKSLNLAFTKVTDAGLVHLEGLTQLESLGVGVPKVTDAGLAHLKGLTQLRRLTLSGTQVTDAGLEQLKDFNKLQWLYLEWTKVTDAGVKKLKQVLPNCKIDRSDSLSPPTPKANDQSDKTSAAKPADEASPAKDQTATKEESKAKYDAARAKAEDDINIRHAIAVAQTAKAEYEVNKKANEAVPGSIPKSRLNVLSLKCKEADLAVERARHNQRITAEAAKVAKSSAAKATVEVSPASDQSATKEAAKTESTPAPPHGLTAEPNADQAKAIAEIEKLGGHVAVDEKSPGKPVILVDLQKTKVTDAGLEHLRGLPQLQSLVLLDTQITDAGLAHLKGSTKLQSLFLNITKVTDAGLVHLKGLTQLQTLQVSLTKVTDAGLVHLKGLTRLQGLNLDGIQVTDAGLENLKGLTQLQSLNLVGTQVTDAGLEHLKGLTQLRRLDLDFTKVTDAGLVHLKGLTKLQWLALDSTKVSDAGLVHLKGLTQLQLLGLATTQVTDAGLIHLEGLTQLQTLYLWDTQITDAGLKHLNGLTQLQDLGLRNTKVTDAGLKYLTGLTQLHDLDLDNTQVTDAGLTHLNGLVQLRSLNLTHTKVTDKGFENLKGLSQIKSLGPGGTEFDDAGLEHLKGLTQLQKLDLRGTKVTDAGLIHLKGLSQLKSLVLRETQITSAGLEHLKGLTQLQDLNLHNTKVTDAGLVYLKELTQIQMLFLGGNHVTDAGLEHLTGLAHLYLLNLENTKVTDAGVKKLQRALPACIIQHKTAKSAPVSPAPAVPKPNDRSGKTSAAKHADEVSPPKDQTATKEGASLDQRLKIVQQATISSYKGLVSGKGSGTYRLSLKDRPDEKRDFEIAFDSDKFNLVLTDRGTYFDHHDIAVSDGSATVVRFFGASLDQGSKPAYILPPGTANLVHVRLGLPSVDLPGLTRSSLGPKVFETFSINVVKLSDGRLRGTYDINKVVSMVFEAVPESGCNICRWEGFNKTGGRTGTICTAEWKRDGKVWYVAAWTREDFHDGVVRARSELRYKEFTANPKLSPELFTLQQLHVNGSMVDLRPGLSKAYYFYPEDIASKPKTISEQVESMPWRS